MNILAVDFHNKKLTKVVDSKKELATCRGKAKRTYERNVVVYIDELKAHVTLRQYIKILEAIVSNGHHRRTTNVIILKAVNGYFDLI